MQFTPGEISGTAGVFLLLLAFLMNLLKRWKQQDLPYIILNVIGAGLACVSSMLIHFVPFIVLEGAWTLVSLIALINYFRTGRSEK